MPAEIAPFAKAIELIPAALALAPIAAEKLPLAFVDLPTAVALTPMELDRWPIAIDVFPVASAFSPTPMACFPDALDYAPTATEAWLPNERYPIDTALAPLATD